MFHCTGTLASAQEQSDRSRTRTCETPAIKYDPSVHLLSVDVAVNFFNSGHLEFLNNTRGHINHVVQEARSNHAWFWVWIFFFFVAGITSRDKSSATVCCRIYDDAHML